MAASVQNPADVINLSLARLGYRGRIGHLFDGSAAAKKALDIYGQTRDAVLRESDWDFSEKIAAAVVSGVAAPAPWSVSYTYPADCLRLRNLFNATYLADKNNPVSNLYTIASSSAGRVVLCNAASATFVYTAQITDPAKWEPLFIEALVAALSRRLAPALASLEALKAEAEDEKISTAVATGVTG